ncbi:MAG: aminomethyl transferase family protein, partial [Gemmatimonadetes bacterium]|nr:aminomethyl transferase family protein [Gemmatimonadota bacterium]
MSAATESLEEKLQSWKNPVDMLRNAPTGPYIFPIAPEFSNWRDEQEAWNKTAVLFDLSRHMTDIYFEGPDLLRLLSDLAVNTLANFAPNKAKQIVCCNADGYVIGDAILFGLEENKVNISGRPSVPNWIAYHAETGDYDVAVSRDHRAVQNTGERKTYRFQVQGPNAAAILEAATGAELPKIKFFNIGKLTVAGRQVNALNHGMARTQGLELWGPAQDAEVVRSAIVAAGEAFGLKEAGARAYSTVSPESGWVPSPMPAIFSDSMKAYRQWLPADGFEANASLGGSFYSDNIEDYYQTPWDLGYGRHVKFDHDFIGRDALEQMADRPHRDKVWLVWNNEDVTRIFASMLGDGERYKYLEMPGSHYSTLPFDKVLLDGEMVGLSTYNVYTTNVRAWFSLAMVDT